MLQEAVSFSVAWILNSEIEMFCCVLQRTKDESRVPWECIHSDADWAVGICASSRFFRIGRFTSKYI